LIFGLALVELVFKFWNMPTPPPQGQQPSLAQDAGAIAKLGCIAGCGILFLIFMVLLTLLLKYLGVM
jgi:hypothetical protein